MNFVCMSAYECMTFVLCLSDIEIYEMLSFSHSDIFSGVTAIMLGWLVSRASQDDYCWLFVGLMSFLVIQPVICIINPRAC